MIDLNKIKSRSSITNLENYNGKNPYLRNLKADFIKNRNPNFTETQNRYINDFHNVDPQLINRVVLLQEYFGLQLQEQLKLDFVPKKILIEFMLADTDKSYHVLGKLTTKQKESKMYWLPKSMVLDDPYFEDINVNVDFEKYNKVFFDKKGFKVLKHQEEGIKFLLARKKCILGDSMGVAKTLTSIIAALEGKYKKILVICPASIKINWEREINIFDDNTCIVDGMRWEENKFTIINYDILRNFHSIGKSNAEEGEIDIKNIVNANFDLIIIDEAHKIKDKDSVRSQIINDICLNYGDKDVWLLSGTPVANRPMDFYNLLKLIKSPLVENWNFYVKRYCDGKQITTTLKNGSKKKVWITNGASNLEELHIRTKNILLRRLKSEVLDMPEKTITNVFHKLDKTSLKEYNSIWDEYLLERKTLKKKGVVNREMVESIFLRKFIAMQSIPHTIEMVKNAIEQGEKVVVFTTFKDEQKQLEEAFGNTCVIHNGDMSNKEKQFSVDTFQNKDKIKVFIGNVISAGVGITLTSGSICIFNSFSWVPGENEQCEDRIFRLGQVNNCKIYYQVFLDTISIKMLETLKKKSENINKIVGDKQKEDSLESILEEILDNE